MCILSIELVIDDYIVNSIIRAKEVNDILTFLIQRNNEFHNKRIMKTSLLAIMGDSMSNHPKKVKP